MPRARIDRIIHFDPVSYTHLDVYKRQDIDVAPNWFMNVDVRYISIESDASLNGVGIGTVEIDPWIVGLNVGTRF